MSVHKVKLKFRCTRIDRSVDGTKVYLAPVYAYIGEDEGTPRPDIMSGEWSLTSSNEQVVGGFVVRKEYYIDITAVE